MSTTPPPRIHARSHEDLLAAVPCLLGFHPADSLVFVFARDCRVAVTGRIDLDAVLDTDEAALADLAGYLDHVVHTSGADQVSLITYGDDLDLGLDALRIADELSPVPVADCIHATDTHFWAACCADDPMPEPYDPRAHRVTAEAVVAGVPMLPNREALAQLAQGPDPDDPICVAAEAAATRQLLDHSPEQNIALLESLVLGHLHDPASMDATTCALAALLVRDIPCRDAAWLLMERADAHLHIALWSRIVQHTLPQWQVAPLCLLGLAAWIDGSGALLVECVKRALAADPDYSLARLMDDLQRRAIPPQCWEELRRTMQRTL